MTRIRLDVLAVTVGFVIAIAAPAQTLAHERGTPNAASAHRCTCEAVRAENGWCDACGVGYVAELRVPSALLYELIDPHGHDVDLSGVACPACHAALASDGYCEEHAMGFVQGQAYVTKLAYRLAHGDRIQDTREYRRLRASLSLLGACEYCALACFDDGRCPKCDIHYRDGERVAARSQE